MSLAILFHFLCAQHVSEINISIIRSLRLFCWITTLVVLFSNTHRTKNNTTNVVIQQNSRKLLMMDILISETCWAHKQWNKIANGITLTFYSSTITMMHGPINIKYKELCLTEIMLAYMIICIQRDGQQQKIYCYTIGRYRHISILSPTIKFIKYPFICSIVVTCGKTGRQ